MEDGQRVEDLNCNIMTYSEKLKDPRWQKKRLEILNRDNWTCQLCGNTEAELQIHHKTYKKNKEPWECEDSNLITLCRYCHEMETAFSAGHLKIIEAFGTKNEKGLTNLFYLVKCEEYTIIATAFYEKDGDLHAGQIIDKTDLELMQEMLKRHKL